MVCPKGVELVADQTEPDECLLPEEIYVPQGGPQDLHGSESLLQFEGSFAAFLAHTVVEDKRLSQLAKSNLSCKTLRIGHWFAGTNGIFKALRQFATELSQRAGWDFQIAQSFCVEKDKDMLALLNASADCGFPVFENAEECVAFLEGDHEQVVDLNTGDRLPIGDTDVEVLGIVCSSESPNNNSRHLVGGIDDPNCTTGATWALLKRRLLCRPCPQMLVYENVPAMTHNP